MKKFFSFQLCTVALSFVFNVSIGFAKTTVSPKAEPAAQPTAKPTVAQFFYFENYPNQDLTVVFSLNKVCSSGFNLAPFSYQEFQSEQKWPVNGDPAIKKTSIRVVNLYGRYNPGCTQSTTEKYEQSVKIPRSKYMTHLYVTTDTDIQVSTQH